METRRWAILTAALLASACGGGDDLGTSKGALKADHDALTLSLVGQTATTIQLRVCAGASGAEAGFTLQWVPADQYLNGWPATEPCDASFSGNARDSRFELAANQCVVVEVGALGTEPGLSYSCNALQCGTTYYFRAFAHGSSDLGRSAFSTPQPFSTGPCPVCVLGQGYWKNHPADWPVSTLTLGTVQYTQQQLLDLLKTPARGNGLIPLAYQLIAAKLNIANGSSGLTIASTIAAADLLIGGQQLPAASCDPKLTGGLTELLTNYNEGRAGPLQCVGEVNTDTAPEMQ